MDTLRLCQILAPRGISPCPISLETGSPWAPLPHKVTLLNETVHWGMKADNATATVNRQGESLCAPVKVPAAMLLFDKFRDLGPHSGLFMAVALSTCGEARMSFSSLVMLRRNLCISYAQLQKHQQALFTLHMKRFSPWRRQVAATGWSERFGVHMGSYLSQDGTLQSSRASCHLRLATAHPDLSQVFLDFARGAGC